MNKYVLMSVMVLAAGLVNAQQAIPNGSFEQWNTTQFQTPSFFSFTSNQDAFRMGLPFNCTKVSDAYHGSYAIKLLTVANAKDSLFGYFVNGQPQDDPMNWHGGSPYAQQATGVSGYYKSDVMTGDTAVIIVAFSKAGVNIGTYFYAFTGQHTAYTPFTLTFFPALGQVPDSVMFAAASSNPGAAKNSQAGKPGSMLQLDSVAFTGVSSQPTLFDGDFEQWNTVTAEQPVSWYINESRDIVNNKTTTAWKGTYAVKLESRMDYGENGMSVRARPDRMSTGYYPANCNQCDEVGGYPFTNQTDTLIFWYRYTPAGGSKAAVMTKLKKNGATVGGNYTELDAAATYQYMEVPVSGGLAPDTFIVDFEATRWTDSLITHIGAVLYVDEVQLKSQRLHTGGVQLRAQELVMLYPSPTHGTLHVSLPPAVAGATVEFANALGQVMLQTNVAQRHTEVDVHQLPAGLYFCRVHTDEGVQVSRLVIR